MGSFADLIRTSGQPQGQHWAQQIAPMLMQLGQQFMGQRQDEEARAYEEQEYNRRLRERQWAEEEMAKDKQAILDEQRIREQREQQAAMSGLLGGGFQQPAPQPQGYAQQFDASQAPVPQGPINPSPTTALGPQNGLRSAVLQDAANWQKAFGRMPTQGELQFLLDSRALGEDGVIKAANIRNKMAVNADQDADNKRADRRLPGQMAADEALVKQREASAAKSGRETAAPARSKEQTAATKKQADAIDAELTRLYNEKQKLQQQYAEAQALTQTGDVASKKKAAAKVAALGQKFAVVKQQLDAAEKRQKAFEAKVGGGASPAPKPTAAPPKPAADPLGIL